MNNLPNISAAHLDTPTLDKLMPAAVASADCAVKAVLIPLGDSSLPMSLVAYQPSDFST